MIIYRIAKDIPYYEIAHKPTKENKVWLWVMDRNGSIRTFASELDSDFHGSNVNQLSIKGAISQGRYEPSTGKCSIAYLRAYDGEKISTSWTKGILRSKFPKISNFYEYELENAKANCKINIYKVANKTKKTFLKEYGGYDVYLVNEEEIRCSCLSDEEFTNFAIHQQFPSLVPKNEIWVGEEVSVDERKFFINNAVKLYNLINNGTDISSAYDIALKYEKALREKMDGIKNVGEKVKSNPPEEIYIKKHGILGDIEVWIIDGELARDLYKTDYCEGGHGYVYNWIPKDEIWIEKDINEDEIPFILHHEYTELKLMRDKDMNYEEAHDISAKKEFELRNKYKK